MNPASRFFKRFCSHDIYSFFPQRFSLTKFKNCNLLCVGYYFSSKLKKSNSFPTFSFYSFEILDTSYLHKTFRISENRPTINQRISDITMRV